MKIHREKLELKSSGGNPDYFCITENVQNIYGRSGIKNGICVVYTHHTTCSVMIQERSFDESFTGQEYLNQDLTDIFEAIIPTCRKEGQYQHPGPKAVEFAAQHGETKKQALNTDAHLRSALLGRSETVVIFDGNLDLGKFGHIYFVDFDQTRPRERTVQVQIIGE
jgi:secondary thiamine-phosphate synthase enzyme